MRVRSPAFPEGIPEGMESGGPPLPNVEKAVRNGLENSCVFRRISNIQVQYPIIKGKPCDHKLVVAGRGLG